MCKTHSNPGLVDLIILFWYGISQNFPLKSDMLSKSPGSYATKHTGKFRDRNKYPFSNIWANFTHYSWLPRLLYVPFCRIHYGDVIMGAIASQITSLTIVYSTVYSDAYERKHQSSSSLAFVRGIHREPVNTPHKWPVTRKMFPFDDVIMRIIVFTMTWSKQLYVYVVDNVQRMNQVIMG